MIEGEKMIKIMLVDDEKDQIFCIKAGFEELFGKEYEIIPADSGKQCIKLLEKNIVPDIILLDIMMPKMNGWEVFDKLRANKEWKKIPVVILTARSDGFAEHAGGLIADDFIEKPIDIKELKTRIDNVIKKKSKK
jgi:CheY-like chemotaxis protein